MLLLTALDGLGQFGTQHSVYREGPLTIQVVDMDLDGDNDLLLGSRLGVSFLRNVNGTGTLSSTVTVSLLEVARGQVIVPPEGGLEGLQFALEARDVHVLRLHQRQLGLELQ